MYDIEKYYQAKDVADCIRALREDPDAVIISGGSDVLIKIREGKMAGCSLVSIHGIPELEGISMEEDGTIVIGPATTFSHITNNDIIKKHIPILGNAVDQAGGPQLRNIGTIGGNVCNGVTSADSASLSLIHISKITIFSNPLLRFARGDWHLSVVKPNLPENYVEKGACPRMPGCSTK